MLPTKFHKCLGFTANTFLTSRLTSPSSLCFCLFLHPLLYRRLSERWEVLVPVFLIFCLPDFLFYFLLSPNSCFLLPYVFILMVLHMIHFSHSTSALNHIYTCLCASTSLYPGHFFKQPEHGNRNISFFVFLSFGKQQNGIRANSQSQVKNSGTVSLPNCYDRDINEMSFTGSSATSVLKMWDYRKS